MPLHCIMEDDEPRVELKPGFSSKPLHCAAHRRAWEARDGFLRDAAAKGMAKMDLTFTFARTESSIEQPGSVNEEGLLSESFGILLGWWFQCVVGIVLESHGWSEKRRIQVCRSMGFSQNHVIRESEKLEVVST